MKAACRRQLARTQYAEAFKFIGPRLPLEGFLLKKILGGRLIAGSPDPFIANRDFQ